MDSELKYIGLDSGVNDAARLLKIMFNIRVIRYILVYNSGRGRYESTSNRS